MRASPPNDGNDGSRLLFLLVVIGGTMLVATFKPEGLRTQLPRTSARRGSHRCCPRFIVAAGSCVLVLLEVRDRVLALIR